MNLGDKLRSLRAIEGSLRGLGRPMTKSEVVEAMKAEVGRGCGERPLPKLSHAFGRVRLELRTECVRHSGSRLCRRFSCTFRVARRSITAVGIAARNNRQESYRDAR